MTSSSVADWISICQLTARYNRFFDVADGRRWAETFEPGGRLTTNQGLDLVGHDQLAAFVASRGVGYVHLSIDSEIDVDGDEAVQRCSLLMYHRDPAQQTTTFLTTGRYVDQVIRTKAGWRFRHRQIELDAPIGGERTR